MIKLSLIGMSGVGKSYLTDKLVSAGFRAIRVDDIIEKKLARELVAGGYRGIGGVAAWMGWPDQPHYRERANQYLQCEIEAMREALDEVELRSAGEGIVLDTTGSVVYTGEDTCLRLKRLTTVVYLATSAAEENILIERYLSSPKPVLWGEAFSQGQQESAADAVARCYPILLEQRKELYSRYAERLVPIESLRNSRLDARGFLELLDARTRHAR